MSHDRFAYHARDHAVKLGTEVVSVQTFPRTIDTRTKVSLVSELDETTKACEEALVRGVDVLQKYLEDRRREIREKHEVRYEVCNIRRPKANLLCSTRTCALSGLKNAKNAEQRSSRKSAITELKSISILC